MIVRRFKGGGAVHERASPTLLMLLAAAILAGFAPAIVIHVVLPGTGGEVFGGVVAVAGLGCALCMLYAPVPTIRAAAPTAGAVGSAVLVMMLLLDLLGLLWIPAALLWAVLAMYMHRQGGANAGDLIIAAFVGVCALLACIVLSAPFA